jgi:ABC-2 type transport system permease protein
LFSSANQFGIDGSAAWIPFSATSRWQDLRDDLAGKSLAGAVLTVPVFALLYLVLGVLRHDARGAAIAFALAICACGTSSAVATIISVLLPVAIPERRSSAFGGGGAGQGCLAAVATFAGLGVALALMTPIFVAWAMLHSGVWLLLAGPGYGAVAAWAGRIVAARVGFRRLPEMLAVVSRAV